MNRYVALDTCSRIRLSGLKAEKKGCEEHDNDYLLPLYRLPRLSLSGEM